MEQQVDGGKQSAGTRREATARGLLQRGWNRVESPLSVRKDPVAVAGTPRSVAATSTHRLMLPSPTEYPRLFDVRGPSSARSADAYASRSRSNEVGVPMPQSARGYSSGSTRSWNTSKRTETTSRRKWLEHGKDGDQKNEEQHVTLPMRHHNLHSVLTNPNAQTWGDTLLDAFYPASDTDVTLAPYSDLEDGPVCDFQSYLRQFGTNAAKFEKNHRKPVHEQLSSSNVPSISVADGNTAFVVCFATRLRLRQLIFMIL